MFDTESGPENIDQHVIGGMWSVDLLLANTKIPGYCVTSGRMFQTMSINWKRFQRIREIPCLFSMNENHVSNVERR